MGFGKAPVPRPVPETGNDLSIDHAILRILNGPGQGTIYRLNKTTNIIGRNDPPNIIVDIDFSTCIIGDTPKVSRRHAELIWIEEKLYVRDLGSVNGTRYNGELLPINKLVPQMPTNSLSDNILLQKGDKILFADIITEVTNG